MKEILVDYSKEFLLLNELNSMRIHREIEELAKFDVDHMHMIEKDRLNRSEKVFQAFRPEVSNEENSRSIPIEKKIKLGQSKQNQDVYRWIRFEMYHFIISDFRQMKYRIIWITSTIRSKNNGFFRCFK